MSYEAIDFRDSLGSRILLFAFALAFGAAWLYIAYADLNENGWLAGVGDEGLKQAIRLPLGALVSSCVLFLGLRYTVIGVTLDEDGLVTKRGIFYRRSINLHEIGDIEVLSVSGAEFEPDVVREIPDAQLAQILNMKMRVGFVLKDQSGNERLRINHKDFNGTTKLFGVCLDAMRCRLS